MLYSVPQLRLLILLALTLLVGLGVREWRAGFPDAAERLERFDRDEPPAPLLSEAPSPAHYPVPSREASDPAAAPPVGAPPTRLDINRAGAAALAGLPGIGPGLAQRIVEERQRRGRFESTETLRYVRGMGPKKLAAIRRFITVSE
ncbi:MAG: ComEA family DNA-binding protein [Candidatus Rokuibacteriota bacterium]